MTTTDVGEVVQGYALAAVLGRGGMGCVYKAIHVRLGRTVALKVLSSELASSEEYVSRFLAEAKIVNDVRHPNIVDISDFIELDEPRRVAYVMEFIDGPSLGRVLKERRLSVVQAINVSLQICAALESVHRLDVVHRDLKPDNILVLEPLETDLSSVPSIKILDFGIAKSSDPTSAHKTVTGSVMGTPSYMAPEQVAAQSVSAATDVYAIGEILFEMLTGRRLYAGAPLLILKTKLLGDLPDLSLPEDVRERDRIGSLIGRCLAHDACDRPTIAQITVELSAILRVVQGTHTEDILLPIERPAPPEDTARNMSSAAIIPERSGSLALLASGVLLSMVAAALGAFLYLSRSTPTVLEQRIETEQPRPAMITPAPEPPPVEALPPKPEPAPKLMRPKKRAPVAAPKEPIAPEKPKAKGLVKKKDLMPW